MCSTGTISPPGTAFPTAPSRASTRTLDRQLGYHPLAIRLNRRHGFHAERMQPGHPNWMLDTNRDSRLPHRPRVEHAMERWFFSPRRHVPRRLLEAMRRDCSGLLLSNVQPMNAVPFLTAARRLGLPVVAHVASWDHTVGKGVISPHCDLYVVQNRVMEDDLRRYHGISPERVRVTGWPQTDLFHRVRPRAEYDASYAATGSIPAAPSSSSGQHAEQRALRGSVRRASRPVVGLHLARGPAAPLPSPPARHPWRERFAAAAARRHRAAGGELLGLRRARDAAPARGCRRLQRGHDPARRARGGRPAVCVLYDEGAPPGESWAAKNLVGEHYHELAAPARFIVPSVSRRSWRASSAHSPSPRSSPRRGVGRWPTSSERSTDARRSGSSRRSSRRFRSASA